nr:hypothetical protein [Spirulina major]
MNSSPKGVRFNRHGLDLALNGARVPILIDFVPNPDPVATEEFVPSLLEGEGFVIFGFS